MNPVVAVLLSFVAGILLGSIFFGGLWWTVRKGLSAKQPALWFLSSFLIRTAFLLTGLYVVGRAHWGRMAIALVGVVIARVAVLRLTPTAEQREASPDKEACNAS